MNKSQQKDSNVRKSAESQAWHIFGLLSSFISADIGLHKLKGKPKFPPHIARCLFILAHQTEPISLGTLAQNLAVSLPRASRICEDMVNEGFLSRERSASDRREIELRVTQKAVEFNSVIWNERKQPLKSTLQTFTPDEIRIIERFIETLTEQYKTKIEEP